jgi:hypothetical protein
MDRTPLSTPTAERARDPNVAVDASQHGYPVGNSFLPLPPVDGLCPSSRVFMLARLRRPFGGRPRRCCHAVSALNGPAASHWWRPRLPLSVIVNPLVRPVDVAVGSRRSALALSADFAPGRIRGVLSCRMSSELCTLRAGLLSVVFDWVGRDGCIRRGYASSSPPPATQPGMSQLPGSTARTRRSAAGFAGVGPQPVVAVIAE